MMAMVTWLVLRPLFCFPDSTSTVTASIWKAWCPVKPFRPPFAEAHTIQPVNANTSSARRVPTLPATTTFLIGRLLSILFFKEKTTTTHTTITKSRLIHPSIGTIWVHLSDSTQSEPWKICFTAAHTTSSLYIASRSCFWSWPLA